MMATKTLRAYLVSYRTLLGSGVLLLAVITAVSLYYSRQPNPTAETIIFAYQDVKTNGIYQIDPDGNHRRSLMTPNLSVKWTSRIYSEIPSPMKRVASQPLQTILSHSPAWSANGSQIIYKSHSYRQTCGDEFIILDLKQNESTTLNCQPFVTRTYDETFDWSADSKLIVFALRKNTLRRINSTTINVINKQGEQVQTFYPAQMVWGLAWAPDATRFAATMRNEASLQIYSLDGSVATLMTDGPVYGKPSWSPDGKMVAAFCYFKEEIDVCISSVDGTHSQRIAFPYPFPYLKYYLRWSPNGEKLSFTAQQRGGSHDLFVMNPDGTDLQQLTFHPASDFEPTWSPDGKQIAFISQRDGNKEIYTIGVDGSNLRRITDTLGDETEPIWKPAYVSN